MHPDTFPKKSEANARFLTDAFAQMTAHTPPYGEIAYFKNVIQKRTTENQRIRGRHPVVVLGTGIPEELVYACGEAPYWILGGNPGTVQLSDDVVPRDTDPVSRSTFGMIRNLPERYLERAMFVIPLINDSSRKLAYILKSEGRKICTMDVPPMKTPEVERQWQRQIEKLSEALVKHTGRLITKRALENAQIKVASARQKMRVFLRIASSNANRIPGTWRMLVMQSYYYADNLDEWTTRLVALSSKALREVAAFCRPRESRVLLMGSPVYFPNYKIPFLIEEAGMEIAEQLDCTSQRVISDTRIAGANLGRIAKGFYQNDASTAYSQNDAMFDATAKIISRNPIDGVVYHVLKGQIEYDFELERLEKLFSEHSIPICRLETDYSYQDIEQLRIRIDAFREVLTHRNRRKEAYAI